MRPDFDGIDSDEIELLYQAHETVDMEEGGSPCVLLRGKGMSCCLCREYRAEIGV